MTVLNGLGISVTSRYIAEYIYAGYGFSVSQRFTVPTEDYFQLLFDPTACTKKLIVFPPVFSSTGGPIDIDYYTATGYTEGTTCYITKRAYYGGANLCTLTYNPTGVNKGTLYAQNMIPATKDSGADTVDEVEGVVPTNAKILIDMYNYANQDVVVLFRTLWFEVPGQWPL